MLKQTTRAILPKGPPFGDRKVFSLAVVPFQNLSPKLLENRV